MGVPSREVPGKNLVEPGDPAASFLFEKINCANPQVGNRMRPTGQMSLPRQALVRDWIAQGARRSGPVTNPDAAVSDVGDGAAEAGVEPRDGGGSEDGGPADGAVPDAALAMDAAPGADDAAGPAADARPADRPSMGPDAGPTQGPRGRVGGAGCSCQHTRSSAGARPDGQAGLSLWLVLAAVGIFGGRRRSR